MPTLLYAVKEVTLFKMATVCVDYTTGWTTDNQLRLQLTTFGRVYYFKTKM